ncbi:chlororespiratory reduction 6 domain-containing protein [Moorena sp. SIO3B2]|nr:chlororespiratory reduction 6 domain-containing protein [Moorena sp. SIO3B2]
MQSQSRLKSMAQLLGYELDDTLFDLIEISGGDIKSG